MKEIKLLGIFVLLFLVTGCMGPKQTIEKTRIENEIIDLMIDYLKDNYDVKSVSNVDAQYIEEGDIFPKYVFSGKVLGDYKYNDETYSIMCDYDEKKCYDSYAYEKMVMPLFIDYFKNGLNLDPEKVSVYDVYNKENIKKDYGYFNNQDVVNNIQDIIDYYDTKSFKLVFNSVDKLLFDKIDDTYQFATSENIELNLYVYNNGKIIERLSTKGIKPNYNSY